MSGLDRFRVRRCAKAGRMLRTIRHRGVTRTLLPDAVQHNARAHSDAKARGHLSLWTEAWPTQPNTVPEGKSVCRQKGDSLPLRQVNANKSPQTLKRPTLRPQLPERRLTHHGACARCCRAAWRRQSRSGRPVRALRRRPWSMPTTARANREAGDAEARVRPVRSRFGRISVLGHAE
jgi:hypothetical protein